MQYGGSTGDDNKGAHREVEVVIEIEIEIENTIISISNRIE